MEFTGWTPIDMTTAIRTADLQRMGAGRPSGLHLGQIIHMMKEAAGEAVGEVEGDQPMVRMAEGFWFETIAEYLMAGMPFDDATALAFKRWGLHLRGDVVKQVQLERDGIHMTPDGIDPTVPELLSFKSTRRSLRKARTREDFEANFWTWVLQESCYCAAAGIDRVRWIVWWQAGDYSRGKGTGPQVLEAAATFTQGELDANWRGVCAIAERERVRRKEVA